MMKKYFSLAITLLSLVTTQAQYNRQVVVELFTNTRCSICASRNPGFYQTLSGYPQVIHMAFHPSSPYQSCLFSQQNKTENDARTNYYNLYGSTSQFVLNGKHLPSANPAINNTTLDTALNQTSPIQVEAIEEYVTADSIKVTVTVRVGGATPVANALLFAGVAEEPVLYSAPNGENTHHDVFRKALTAVTGNSFQLPQAGDSVVFEFGYQVQSGWDIHNLHTTAWVQRADTREILNADESERLSSPLGVGEVEEEEFTVYPNPFENELTVNGLQITGNTVVEVRDITGRLIEERKLTTEDLQLNTTGWAKGVYFLRVGDVVKRIVKH